MVRKCDVIGNVMICATLDFVDNNDVLDAGVGDHGEAFDVSAHLSGRPSCWAAMMSTILDMTSIRMSIIIIAPPTSINFPTLRWSTHCDYPEEMT